MCAWNKHKNTNHRHSVSQLSPWQKPHNYWQMTIQVRVFVWSRNRRLCNFEKAEFRRQSDQENGWKTRKTGWISYENAARSNWTEWFQFSLEGTSWPPVRWLCCLKLTAKVILKWLQLQNCITVMRTWPALKLEKRQAKNGQTKGTFVVLGICSGTWKEKTQALLCNYTDCFQKDANDCGGSL